MKEPDVNDNQYDEGPRARMITIEDNGKTEKSKQGKKNRAAGQRFELSVRKDLEKNGWIVAKWTNNVEFNEIIKMTKNPENYPNGKLIPAKRKYNPFTKRPMAEGTGFPDFIAYQEMKSLNEITPYEVIGVEAKSNGILDKVEKEKCRWLLENNKFSKILIAEKGKKRGEIIYKEFK